MLFTVVAALPITLPLTSLDKVSSRDPMLATILRQIAENR